MSIKRSAACDDLRTDTVTTDDRYFINFHVHASKKLVAILIIKPHNAFVKYYYHFVSIAFWYKGRHNRWSDVWTKRQQRYIRT